MSYSDRCYGKVKQDKQLDGEGFSHHKYLLNVSSQSSETIHIAMNPTC